MAGKNLSRQFEEKRVFNSTLTQADADNLNWIMSLSKDQFYEFYDTLDVNETIYVEALLDTFKLDVLDEKHRKEFELDEDVTSMLIRISRGI